MKSAAALVLISLTCSLAFSDSKFNSNFQEKVLAAQGNVRVTFLSPVLTGGMEGWGLPNYLLIERGSSVYVEPFTEGWPDDISASILDIGVKPVVLFSISVLTSNQSGSRFMRLYRVADDVIQVFSPDIQDPPSPHPRTLISKVAGGWGKLEIVPGPVQDRTDFLVERAVYLSYDSKNDTYAMDDYTAPFETKTIEDENSPLPSAEVYFQLSDDRVNMRQSPSTTAAVVATLPRNALFDIVDRSEDPQTIGGKTARWYKVSITLNDKKTEGWVFGAFIKKK